MLEKQAINDKLQGSVATNLRCGGDVSEKIKTGEYLAKLQARRWLYRALSAPGHHTAKKDEDSAPSCYTWLP